jgi:hypothetical protein
LDNAEMHFNFTTVQVIWTLTFAALLVLLVVLLGRDRARRFPWFTVSIILVALRLLASRLLFGKLPQLTLSQIFIVLADVMMLVSLLVLVELACRAFGGVQRRAWIPWTLAMVAVGAFVMAVWGPWPTWKTATMTSQVATFRLMQLVDIKGALLVNVLTVELGLLMALFGSDFKAGWRSHTQQIMIGLTVAAAVQMAVEGILEVIAHRSVPHSQADYEHLLGIRDTLVNVNGWVYMAVIVGWIVCLWFDEPGANTAVPEIALETDEPLGESLE